MTFQHLSHSTVKGLLGDPCAYQQFLSKVKGLKQPTHPAAVRGSAYHKAIEYHEVSRRNARLGLPGFTLGGVVRQSMYEEAGKYVNKQDLGDEDLDRAYVETTTAIDHWWDSEIPEGQPGEGGTLRDRVMEWEPISVELDFRMWLPDSTFLPTVGSADCIYLDRDGLLVIVDHKSTGSFRFYPHDGDGLEAQAAMYALAAVTAPNLPGDPDRLPRFEYHIARTEAGSTSRFQGVRVVQVDVDDTHLDYVKDRLSRAQRRILEGDFPKNPDSFLCSPEWCGFHQDAGGPCDPHGPPEFDTTAPLP